MCEACISPKLSSIPGVNFLAVDVEAAITNIQKFKSCNRYFIDAISQKIQDMNKGIPYLLEAPQISEHISRYALSITRTIVG